MGQEDIVTGWLAGNLAYIVVTIVLLSILDVGLSISGPTGDSLLANIWNAWLLIGGLLGVADLIMILRPILSALDGF